jgi:hypothetical protein
MNAAVDIIDQHFDDFDNDDDFYDVIFRHSSTEFDEFMISMATSKHYRQDTIQALINIGYEIGEAAVDDDDIDTMAKELIKRIGKKRLVSIIMDL